MGLLAFWLFLGFAVAVAVLAAKFGRSIGGWFLLAILLSPLVAAIILLVLGSKRKCPECKGGIDKDAKKCKHCGIVLVVEPSGITEQVGVKKDT